MRTVVRIRNNLLRMLYAYETHLLRIRMCDICTLTDIKHYVAPISSQCRRDIVTSRRSRTRSWSEHMLPNTPGHGHHNTTSHTRHVQNFKILGTVVLDKSLTQNKCWQTDRQTEKTKTIYPLSILRMPGGGAYGRINNVILTKCFSMDALTS